VKHQAPTFASAKYQISCFFDFCSCKSLCKYFFRKYYFANYLKITLAEAKFGTLCCVLDLGYEEPKRKTQRVVCPVWQLSNLAEEKPRKDGYSVVNCLCT